MPQEEIDEAERLKKFTENIRDAFTISINNFYEQRKQNYKNTFQKYF